MRLEDPKICGNAHKPGPGKIPIALSREKDYELVAKEADGVLSYVNTTSCYFSQTKYDLT